MSVTEGLMTVGSWSLQLTADTPAAVLAALGDLGHVCVHDARQNPQLAGDGLLASARYTGVVRRRRFDNEVREFGGPGMAWWLGDEDGKGPYLEPPGVTFDAASLGEAVARLLPRAARPGTATIMPGAFTGTLVDQTVRAGIDELRSHFTDRWGPAEWRINPDGTVDSGSVADLYVTDPTSIVARDLDGTDMRLRALSGAGTAAQDLESYTTRLAVYDSDGNLTDFDELAVAQIPYRDLFGNPVKITRVVAAAEKAPTAAAQLAALNSPYTTVQLDTDELTVEGPLRVGDHVWLWDPLAGLVDRTGTNETVFRGQRINPLKVRITELTWPIRAGMGVAYRDAAARWTDLTDYVAWENQAAQVTVGDVPRGLLTTS